MANKNIYPVETIVNMHNWWFEILVNYGIYIFLGYLAFYIHIFLALWRIRRKICDRLELMICDALLVGWVSFVFAAVSSSSMLGFRPQWIFCGFVLAFLNYWRNKQEESLACTS